MVKERDVYYCLVCVLVVRGGNEDVFYFFFEYLKLIISIKDKINMYDVVFFLVNGKIIYFVEE